MKPRERAIQNMLHMSRRIREGVAFTTFNIGDFMLPGGYQPVGGVRIALACTLGSLILAEAGEEGVIPTERYDRMFSAEFMNPFFFFSHKRKIDDIIVSIPYNILHSNGLIREDGGWKNYGIGTGNLDYGVDENLASMIVHLNDYTVPAWIRAGLLPADTDPRLFIADWIEAAANEGAFRLEREVNVE